MILHRDIEDNSWRLLAKILSIINYSGDDAAI